MSGQHQTEAHEPSVPVAVTDPVPEDPDKLNDRGADVGAAGQLDDAIKLFRQAIDLYKQQGNVQGQSRALRNLAVGLRDQGDLEKAEQAAREAATVWPQNAAAHRTLGLILRSLKRPEDSLASLQTALRLNPHDPTLNNDVGFALADLKRPAEAIPYYRAASGRWQLPDRKIALRNWADALRALGGTASAEGRSITALQQAIAAIPDDASLYNSLGLAFAAQGDFATAITAYRKSSDLWTTKERKFPLRNWADAQAALDPKADAVPLLRQALDADRSDALTFNALGAELARQHKLDQAIRQYDEASKLWAGSPDRKFALRNWAGALVEQGDTDQASAKAKDALAADGDDPENYSMLGYVLTIRFELDKAIEQYKSALARYDSPTMPRDGNQDGHALACCNLSDVLQRLERFDEAARQLEKATQIKPDDSDIRFRYGNILSSIGRSHEAIEQYGRAVDLDGGNLYARNNKANELFRLGRYEAGWQAWEEARAAFQAAMTAAATRAPADRTRTDAERAGYYGYMLTDVFADFKAADQAFEFALGIADDFPLALCGRAMLYRRWVDSEAVTTEIRLRANRVMRAACNAVQPVPEARDPRHYANLIMLATLAIANREFSAALTHLTNAERADAGLGLRRAEIAVLHGVICLGNEDYEAAARYFRQAQLIKGDDFDVQTRLGQALLGAKRHDDARRAFGRVLEVAPGHIDCLIGAAVARIELGDAGHPEHYERAEQSLNDALLHGRDRQSGSLKLRKVRTAAILYLRGYARVKRWETGAGQARFGLLQDALADFRLCLTLNPGHDLAAAAIEKIGDRGLRHADDVLANRIGPLLLFAAGLVVFVLAVALGLARGKSTDPGYLAMTFGGLAIAMAGLSLPSLLKLKVAGIELQKAAPERSASATAIGLGQFSMGDSLTLATPNSFPADSSGPPSSQPKDSSHGTDTVSAT